MAITKKKDWGTPKVYADAVCSAFGDTICLDPCSGLHSIVEADKKLMPPRDDGLQHTWDYARIHVNPSYGADRKSGTRISDWLRKCADAHDEHGSEIMALVPVATNTGHWKRFVFGRATAICFLHDTCPKFLVNGREGGNGAPMACAMLYYGARHARSLEVFGEHGAVVNIAHMRAPRDV